MRLFVAIVPPDAVLEELGKAVDPLHALPGADRLRWTERAGWHFTLAFLGEVDEKLLPELRERLGRAARRHEPHPLRLEGSGHFGRRVLWVGADGHRLAMQRLAESAAAGAQRAGIATDEHRPYSPHLTIARNQTGVDLRPYVDALAVFAGSEWTVDELSLVRSNLPRGGVVAERPRYETVAAWPLGR